MVFLSHSWEFDFFLIIGSSCLERTNISQLANPTGVTQHTHHHPFPRQGRHSPAWGSQGPGPRGCPPLGSKQEGGFINVPQPLPPRTWTAARLTLKACRSMLRNLSLSGDGCICNNPQPHLRRFSSPREHSQPPNSGISWVSQGPGKPANQQLPINLISPVGLAEAWVLKASGSKLGLRTQDLGGFGFFFALFFGFFRKTQEKLRKKISLCPPKGVKTLIRGSLLGTPKRGNSDTATPYCISHCNRRLTCNKKYRAPTFNQTGVDKVFMPQRRAP